MYIYIYICKTCLNIFKGYLLSMPVKRNLVYVTYEGYDLIFTVYAGEKESYYCFVHLFDLIICLY